MSPHENLEVEVDRLPEEAELPEFEARLTGGVSRIADRCWSRDIERLDAVIGQYFLVAMSADEGFERALKAGYVALELIEMKWKLLESYT